MKIDLSNICGILALMLSTILIIKGIEMSQWLIPLWIFITIVEHNRKKQSYEE